MSVDWETEYVGYNGDHVVISVYIDYWDDKETFEKKLSKSLSDAAIQATCVYDKLQQLENEDA